MADRFLFQHDKRVNTVNILNPISVHNSAMRTSQIPGMLKVLAENHGISRKKINLFEIGNIFISLRRVIRINQSIVQHKMLSLLAVVPVINSNGDYNNLLDFYDSK